MLKKIVLTANLIVGLTGFTATYAASTCFNVSLDDSMGPSLLRPTFTQNECLRVQNALKSSGKFANIFTPQGNNLLLTQLGTPLCFVSNQRDPYYVTNGIHAKLNARKVTIDSASIWVNLFKPNLPAFGLIGDDNQAAVITQWNVIDYQTNNKIGKGFTTDTLNTGTLSVDGSASELNVIIGGTDKLSDASGSIRVDSQLNAQGLVEITSLSGKLCISP